MTSNQDEKEPRVSKPFFEINIDQIDVNLIMAEIERRIKEKQEAGIYPPEDPFPVSRLFGAAKTSAEAIARKIERLELLSQLQLEGDPITSHRPILGPLIKLFKRFTRFWVRKYTDPVFLQLSYLNQEVISVLKDMAEELEKSKQEIAQLKKRLSEKR